jgi:hypothetical protein
MRQPHGVAALSTSHTWSASGFRFSSDAAGTARLPAFSLEIAGAAVLPAALRARAGLA